MKIVSLKNAISQAKKLAESRLAEGMSADEFVEIGNADGFRIYVTAGKTVGDSQDPFHENPRDVFMLILEGEVEFLFQNGEKTNVKARECFVLPKHMKNKCVFKKLAIAVEGIYEKGL